MLAVSTALLTNLPAREKTTLDGLWNVIVDPFETGYYDYRREPMEKNLFADLHFYEDQTKLVEYDFSVSPTLRVPGDWNTQNPKLYYYEGLLWYNRHFTASPKQGKRYFLYFEGANYETIAGLNGTILGKHTGGFTPFNFEVTSTLRKGDNSVTALVDNKRRLENVPTVNFDWWNYGGLTRSVWLVETPETFIRDYSVQISKDCRQIEGWVKLDGTRAAQDVTVSIPELKTKVTVRTDGEGFASFSVKAKPVLWCPENPKLYDVLLTSETDSIRDRIGFRVIETRGNEIFLNGKKVFLRGVSVHEEKPLDAGGRAYSREHARQTISWVKEMNGNFMRLAHYPHNENMIRVAEEMGVMVWSEIPVYWTIDWNNPDTYANAANQLEENITRDRNRANILIWSVANETPRGDARLKFLTGLVKKARELDGTRLVSAAMEKFYVSDNVVTCDDELAEIVDLMSFNQYVGWYDGNPDKCDVVKWTFKVNKPVFISEFGGGAVYGRHADRNVRFSEEYLAYMYEKSIGMLSAIPGLSGTTPWVLKDFRSPKRLLSGTQDDYNRKGLISEYGEKKQAFFVMQNWYSKLQELYK